MNINKNLTSVVKKFEQIESEVRDMIGHIVKKKKCMYCNKVFNDIFDFFNFNGKIVCHECNIKYLKVCSICHSQEENVVINGKEYCKECFGECEFCHRLFLRRDLFSCYGSLDPEEIEIEYNQDEIEYICINCVKNKMGEGR